MTDEKRPNDTNEEQPPPPPALTPTDRLVLLLGTLGEDYDDARREHELYGRRKR